MEIFLFDLSAVVNTKEVHLYIRHIVCCQGHSKVDFKTKQMLYPATQPVLGAFYVTFKTITGSDRKYEFCDLSYTCTCANNKDTGQPV